MGQWIWTVNSRLTCSKAGSRSSSSWRSLRPFPPGYKPGSFGTLPPPRISGGPQSPPRPLYGAQDTPRPRCPRTPEDKEWTCKFSFVNESRPFHLYTTWKCIFQLSKSEIHFPLILSQALTWHCWERDMSKQCQETSTFSLSKTIISLFSYCQNGHS